MGVVGGVVGALLEVGVDVEEDVVGDSDKVEGVGRSEAGEEEEDEVRTLLCCYSVGACCQCLLCTNKILYVFDIWTFYMYICVIFLKFRSHFLAYLCGGNVLRLKHMTFILYLEVWVSSACVW